jgi:hypothetical protein
MSKELADRREAHTGCGDNGALFTQHRALRLA